MLDSEVPPLLDVADTRLLVEIGFLALTAGRFSEAREIFEGALAARPSEEAGAIGIGLTALAAGDVPQAVRHFRALPPSDAASAYLGLALLKAGEREEAERLLRDVAARAREPAFRVLAQATLDEMDR
ncbi:tol-pal system YbgF family protein [Aureimonas sp. AU4]|uniref:tetratricopeptide repeat protein n=1 Tax=Aureimonas sp. AU4 TaxID=1638163 RepID=UPI0007865B6A|nr:tetratricopeptide repeat protein [Aureimonas sp. AU4]